MFTFFHVRSLLVLCTQYEILVNLTLRMGTNQTRGDTTAISKDFAGMVDFRAGGLARLIVLQQDPKPWALFLMINTPFNLN